jgi:hypothetical protein
MVFIDPGVHATCSGCVKAASVLLPPAINPTTIDLNNPSISQYITPSIIYFDHSIKPPNGQLSFQPSNNPTQHISNQFNVNQQLSQPIT